MVRGVVFCVGVCLDFGVVLDGVVATNSFFVDEVAAGGAKAVARQGVGVVGFAWL